jgi:hypothetical protein
LNGECTCVAAIAFSGKKNLDKIKVEVKQNFAILGAIPFEAALALNDIETVCKQKEYTF